jgi:hypothetical protein
MGRFESLYRRLRRLEPIAPRIHPWPPKEGTFSYCLWDAIGKPEERRSYWSMYQERAEAFWKDQNGKI